MKPSLTPTKLIFPGAAIILFVLPMMLPHTVILPVVAGCVVGIALTATRRYQLGVQGLLALASGILEAAAMPGYGLWPIAFVGLMPLLIALRSATRFRYALAFGLITGFTLVWYAMPWGGTAFVNYSKVSSLMGFLMFVPCTMLESYKVIVLSGGIWLGMKRPSRFPLAVIGATLIAALETFSFDLYPWFIGLTQAVTTVSQAADFGGLPLISAVVLLINIMLWQGGLAAANRQWHQTVRFAALAGALISGVWIYGAYRVVVSSALSSGAPTLTIALIQPNSPKKVLRGDSEVRTRICGNLRTLADRAAAKARPDLIVYAEGAAPMGYQVRFHPEFCDTYSSIATQLNVPVLTDNNHIEPSRTGGKPQMWRSAILIGPGGTILAEYLKRQLVLFGEYLPLESAFPALRKLFRYGMSYRAGTESVMIDVHGIKIAPQICFEAIHPDLAREDAARGARMFVNIANDVWYDSRLQARQHLLLSAIRCVENRIPMVRATNSGISAYVNAAGYISGAESAIGEQWSDSRRVSLPLIYSFYREHGPVFGCMCAGIIPLWLGMLLQISLRGRKQRAN